MKYAVYLKGRCDLYVVDVPADDYDALLEALYDMDAPIFCDTVQGYIDECRYRGEDEDEDGNPMTDEALLEEILEYGYKVVRDAIADFSLFIAQPMPPNLEVGYYATEDDMRYSHYKGFGR